MSGSSSSDAANGLTRRELVATLGAATLTATVAPATAEPAAAQSTQAIQRLQVVPGLHRSQADGRDLFSHVVVTSRRRTVYISGQLARDAQGKIVGKGDMRAQMRQVGENIKVALAAVGGTLADVVQTATFVTDWSEFWKAIDIRHEYFGASLPTSTTVQVSALAAPEFMVEISAIAVLD
jgi:enamine deaminase RidA (YjgF/YER057c/UK114 family)